MNPGENPRKSKKRRPEPGRLENWYVIASPRIEGHPSGVLDPEEGFSLDLSMEARELKTKAAEKPGFV